jgi:LysR family transcriptional regulator for bpeEF and oprC
MIDLNDLRVFERVASLRSFSDASKALGMPKSTVSRAITRLEEALALRLFQRTTREVSLTPAGQTLYDRCGPLLGGLEEALTATARLSDAPRGKLTISAGIGFGINVLGKHLPGFLERYPDVTVALDLTSRNAELISEQVDIAIRMGPLADSGMVVARLGTLTQYLCAERSYLDRVGRPQAPADLVAHQAIEFPGSDGRPRTWRLTRGEEEVRIEPATRVEVNDALTIYALVGRGAGVGAISAYLCGEDILSGKLERVLADWVLPPLPVSMVFPSRRELSPIVRAFVDYLREMTATGKDWLADPLQDPQER